MHVSRTHQLPYCFMPNLSNHTLSNISAWSDLQKKKVYFHALQWASFPDRQTWSVQCRSQWHCCCWRRSSEVAPLSRPLHGMGRRRYLRSHCPSVAPSPSPGQLAVKIATRGSPWYVNYLAPGHMTTQLNVVTKKLMPMILPWCKGIDCVAAQLNQYDTAKQAPQSTCNL